MNNSGITREEEMYLDALAKLGFQYSEMLHLMPDHLSLKYEPFYKRRGSRNKIKCMARLFSSITLAVKLGYTAEQRRAYLKNKHKNEAR